MYNVVEHEAELRLARAWPDDKGGRGMQQDPAFIQRPQIETCKKTNHIFKILSSMRGLRSMQDPVRCGHRELGAPGLGRGNLSHCVSPRWGRKVEMDSKDDAGGSSVFSLSSESAVKHAMLACGLHRQPASQTALDPS